MEKKRNRYLYLCWGIAAALWLLVAVQPTPYHQAREAALTQESR